MWLSVISGFLREVDEIHALLGYYVASSGKHLPTFRDNLLACVPGVLMVLMVAAIRTIKTPGT
jgi:hypothetical protein